MDLVLDEYNEDQLEILEANLRKRANYEEFCFDAELFGEETPARHHRLLATLLQKVADGEIDRLMVFAPPGTAKALALDTPIPTPDGWKTIGEIKTGDRVFDERGQPCNVIAVSPRFLDRPVFRVQTDCGDEIIADCEHEWLVRLCRKPRNGGKPISDSRKQREWQPFKIKETWELAKKRQKRPMIERAMPLSLPSVGLPIDPYLLGYWLGDGHSTDLRITASFDDAPWIRGELSRLGYRTTCRDRLSFYVPGVRAKFVELGLLNDPWHNTYGRKHIPVVYMRASADQRLALLQGLIDSDGTVDKRRGAVTFTNTNRDLAEGVRELVRSLGAKAGWSEGRAMLYGKDCGPTYRVHFFLSGAARMPRKAALTRNGARTKNTYVDVEPCGTADTVCIEVDSPSRLFLCGRSMTPTHNSTYVSHRFPAWLMAYKPGIKLIAASHTASLAERNGKRARDLISSPAFRAMAPDVSIADDSTARADWMTTNGGEYFGVGMSGAAIGRRADGVIVDDPFKNRKEADSDVVRESNWDAFRSGLRTRLRKNGWIVLMHQRWHDDDIAGRILPSDWDGRSGWIEARDGEQWFVANLQMECEFPDNDLLGRKEGELLWPEWFDKRRVAQDKKSVGTREWNAMYQGRPRDAEGGILQRRWWRKWPGEKPPKCVFVLQSWDTAFEEDEEDDPSARTTWGVFDLQDEANLAIIQDAVRAGKMQPWRDDKGKLGEVHRYHAVLLERFNGRVEFHALKREAKDGIRRFRPDRVLIEKKSSGHSLIQELRRARIHVSTYNPDRSKRARGWAAQVPFEQGAVWHMDRTWAEEVIDQCARFPTAKHDDLFDTVTMSLIWLRRMYHLNLKGEDDEPNEDEQKELEIED